jgi:hypothetical protein
VDAAPEPAQRQAAARSFYIASRWSHDGKDRTTVQRFGGNHFANPERPEDRRKTRKDGQVLRLILTIALGIVLGNVFWELLILSANWAGRAFVVLKFVRRAGIVKHEAEE